MGVCVVEVSDVTASEVATALLLVVMAIVMVEDVEDEAASRCRIFERLCETMQSQQSNCPSICVTSISFIIVIILYLFYC